MIFENLSLSRHSPISAFCGGKDDTTLLSCSSHILLQFFTTKTILDFRATCMEAKQTVGNYPWRDSETLIKEDYAWKACFPKAREANYSALVFPRQILKLFAVPLPLFAYNEPSRFAELREVHILGCSNELKSLIQKRNPLIKVYSALTVTRVNKIPIGFTAHNLNFSLPLLVAGSTNLLSYSQWNFLKGSGISYDGTLLESEYKYGKQFLLLDRIDYREITHDSFSLKLRGINTIAYVDENYIAVGVYNRIKLFSLNFIEEEVLGEHAGLITNLCAFRCNTINKLISTGTDLKLCFWNIAEKYCITSIYIPFAFSSLCLSGETLCAAEAGRTLQNFENQNIISLWDLSSQRMLDTMCGHSQPIIKLVAIDNGMIASASKDRSIKIWCPASRSCLYTLKLNDIPSAIAYLGNNEVAISVEQSCILEIWKYTEI